MLHPRTTLLVAMAVLVTACEESSPVVAEADTFEESLEFGVPDVTRDGQARRVEENVRTPEPEPMPSRAVLEDTQRPLQEIFYPDTRVGFQPGYAYSLGVHQYIGNMGSVSTTAQVSHLDKHLGSFTSDKQQYTPFLFDFGEVKHIWTQAKVYTDHTCGLSVQGSSTHAAWWQFFTGTGAPAWGTARVTTQAQPVAQGGCSSGRIGQSTGTEERSGGMVCTYFITYDMDTGEWLSAELLFCSTVGGGMI